MRKPCSSSAAGAEAAAPSSGKKTACCTKVGLKRGPWTPEEDELLSGYINKEGEGRWRTLPKRAGLLRCGKSCRLRWMNYLRPSVKRGQIAPDEEDLILRLHRLLGNRWSLIAGRIPGRTDNEIKNYWNTHLSKKLISQGIDPRTHKPLQPADLKLPPSSSKPNRKSSPSPSAVNPNNSSSDEEINANAHIGNNNSPNLNLDYGQDQYGTLGGVGDDDDMNYCTDDVFSSFLNSLINEDSYQQHAANTLIAPPCGDSGFGTAAVGWESALALINHKDPNKLLHDNNATPQDHQ